MNIYTYTNVNLQCVNSKHMTKEKHDLFRIKSILLLFRIFINNVVLSYRIQLKKKHSVFRLPSVSIHVVFMFRLSLYT